MGSVEDELSTFLERISGVTCFRERTKIYAPTCRGKCISEVGKLIEKVNMLTGGSTVYDAEGSWIDPETGKVETEPVKVIEAAHHCLSREQAEKLVEALSEYAREAKQTAIAIYSGNQFYIAETPKLLKIYEEKKIEML